MAYNPEIALMGARKRARQEPKYGPHRPVEEANASRGHAIVWTRWSGLIDSERRSYKRGGLPYLTRRTATVVRDGVHQDVFAPNIWAGDEIVSGLSDKMVNPRRVQRSKGKSKSGKRKGGGGVLR